MPTVFQSFVEPHVDLEENVLPFKLTMEFSSSKILFADFDYGSYDGVPGLAIRALVVEVTHAKDWKNRGIFRAEGD